MLIEVLATPPIVPAAQLAATQKLGSFSAGYLKVRLAVSGAASSSLWRNPAWRPMLSLPIWRQ